jgi:hypothetical protein
LPFAFSLGQAPRVLARAALLTLVLAACSPAPEESSAPGHAATPSPSPSFSRQAFVLLPGDAGAAGLPVPTTADPAVLDEILAAAARALDDGGARPADRSAVLGTDTGVMADAKTGFGRTPQTPGAKITAGKVIQEAAMSSPTAERALRAQIYWPLVQRCRDRRGAILPPEVVRLEFHVDLDGYVIPATILAVPKDRQYEDAALCMARELGMATFRAPAAARGQPQVVQADVPSVD